MNCNKQHLFIMIIVLIVISPAILLAEEKPIKSDLISFKYGVIGKKISNPNNLFEVTDDPVFHTGDFIKINVKMEDKAYFYGIIRSSNGDYFLFYPPSNLNDESNPETVLTSSNWLEFDTNIGKETIYLLASKEPLSKLKDCFVNYHDSNKKLRKKFAKMITRELHSITSDTLEVHLLNALEKPESIGATIRGIEDKNNFENKVFQYCSGKSIAIKVLTIVHE